MTLKKLISLCPPALLGALFPPAMITLLVERYSQPDDLAPTAQVPTPTDLHLRLHRGFSHNLLLEDSEGMITRARDEMSVKFSFRWHSEMNVGIGRDSKRILFKMLPSLGWWWRIGIHKDIGKSGILFHSWWFLTWVQSRAPDSCSGGINNWDTQRGQKLHLEPAHLTSSHDSPVWLALDVTLGSPLLGPQFLYL